MRKEILTGTHSRYLEFYNKLDKALNHRRKNGREVWNCRGHGDLSRTTKILKSMGDIDVLLTL